MLEAARSRIEVVQYIDEVAGTWKEEAQAQDLDEVGGRPCSMLISLLIYPRNLNRTPVGKDKPS